MAARADYLEFAPPPQPGLVRAIVLAVIAHLLLMLALTWGINWNKESENVAAEAELWASVPQQAAPREVAPPPPPPPAQQATPTPPPPPARSEADIALEREKAKELEALRKQQELERQKKLAEARKKREELEREKKLQAKKEEELKKQRLAEQKAAEEKKRKQEELAKAVREEKLREELRKEQMARMMKGATGGPEATGNALRAAGPSDSYAGRIRARVRPNIVFADAVAGNPTAEVEVRLAPDGTITSRRLTKSSGLKSWDEAVLRALDKTEILPKDVDGRVHSPLLIEFKPKG